MQQRPNMEIEINGHRSVYYFRPRISYDPSEFPVAFIPHFGSQQLDIDFPPTFFLKGENRLILTCVDENAEVSQCDRLDSHRNIGTSLRCAKTH